MKKFEYLTVPVIPRVFASNEKYVEQLSMELNAHGAEGWELVVINGSLSVEGYVILVFKQELVA